jgi:redox-sensitive bicupin YhaK (pirin superfamily)
MSEEVRRVERVLPPVDTVEGAGVRLKRLFGHGQVPMLDPFLLLDHFGSSNPLDYEAGFPWHPHRGIETVTYMLNGRVEHGDTLGNSGVIGSGDVQWMSAGSGLLHQEMPKRIEGTMDGFQLWVNLPASRKMSEPEYRGLEAKDFPVVARPDGARIKVVAGSFDGVRGPVEGIPVDPTYLDVALPAHGEFTHAPPKDHTAFGFVIEGEGQMDPQQPHPMGPNHVGVYGVGDSVRVRAGERGMRFLFVTGRPLHEPVAWYGPIVMNTQEQLMEAVTELRRGDFIKHKKVTED